MPARKPIERRFYTAREVKQILGCSTGFAYQLMHMWEQQGKLFKSGRMLRVPIVVFDAWVESCYTSPI